MIDQATGEVVGGNRLTFDASIAGVGGAIRWNSGQNGGRALLEIPETDSPALSWLAAVCRDRKLRVTVEVVDS